MKKTFVLSLALAACLPAMADLGGNGYYRVKNFATDRYVSVVDNHGKIDFVATSADLQAITLNKDFGEISGDAASILYVEKVGSLYNISAQGTSIHKIIDHYVTLAGAGTSGGQKLYMAYGTYDGVTRYLGDGNIMAGNFGEMSVTTTGNYRKWYILPVDNGGDNYFGAVAEIESTAGAYQGLYAPLYTSFPYKAYSDGVEFYTVDAVGDWGQVTLKKIDGVVPASTPVIVKCVGAASSDNRLTPGGTASAVASNAKVKGVFFNCDKGGSHNNRVKYNPDTMRVLGRCADGRLGFVKESIDYIPANTLYLQVPSGSPAEYPCVLDQEFSGVDEIEAEGGNAREAVYTMTGVSLGEKSREEIGSLPAGMYVVGGKKIVVR